MEYKPYQNPEGFIKQFPQRIPDTNQFNIIIPECCREGWESCPHVIKKPKPVKKNIGL